MPLQDVNVYLAEQRKKNGLAFLDRIKATGVDVEQFRMPDGRYQIPISGPNPAFAGGPAPEEQESAPFKRGLQNLGSDFASAASVLTGAVGAQDWSQYFERKSNEFADAAAKNISSVPDIESIHSVGDIATYVYERTAENVPMLASLLIPGAVVGPAARAAGMAGKAVRGLQWTATALTDAGLQIGETASETRAGGNDPIDIRVIGTGLGKAVLDMLPIFAIARLTGIAPILEKNFIAKLTEKGYVKRVAGNAVTIAAIEVPTEVAQESMDIALQRTLQQKSGELTPEEISRLQNAAAGALAVSVGIAPFAGISKPRIVQPPETTPQTPAEADGIPKATVDPFVNPAGLLNGPPQPGSRADYYVNPEGVASRDFGVFDSNGFYDPKTGSPKISGDELRRALVESGRQIKYNASEDKISGTQYARTWKSVYPKWTTTPDGGAVLGEEAKITRVITPEGPGFEVFNVFGIPLGTFPDLPSAMQKGEEFAWQRTPKVSIDANGQAVVRNPSSAEENAVQEARKTKQPGAVETVLIQISDARTRADRKPDLFDANSPEVVSVAQADEGLQKLIELRDDILENRELYKNDGSFTKAGANQLRNVEARIQARSDVLGIPSPVPTTREHVLAKGDVEGQLSSIAMQEAIQKARPKYKNLTDAEAKLHDNLMEKEIIDGLTPREMDTLVGLQEKITEGSREGMYRKPTAQELAEIRQDMNDVEKIMAEEIGRVKRNKRGQMPRLDEKGAYLFSRGGNVLQFPEFKVEELRTAGLPLVEVKADGKSVGYAGMSSDGKYHVFGSMENSDPGPLAEGEIGVHTPAQLGTYSSLREAIAALRKHAVNNLLSSKLSDFDKVRRDHAPLTKEKVVEAIGKIWPNLAIKPRLRIMTLEEFPEGEQRDFAKTSAGFIDLNRAGEITLVVDNLFSQQQAQLVFAHEALLHYGIRAFLSPNELQAVLKEVLRYRAKEIRENAIARGELDPMDSGSGERILNLRDAEEFLAKKMEEAYIRWKAGDKEWMRDSLWEKPGERTFVQKMIDFFRRVFRRLGIHLGPDKWTDPEIASMLKDIALFMTGKLSGRNSVGIDAHWRTGTMRSAVGPANLSEAIPNMNSFAEVWGAKLATGFLTPLQIAEKYKIPGASRYIEQVQLWWARKRDLTTEPVGVAEDWQKMPKREMSNLSGALFEIDKRSEELGRRLSDEELRVVFRESGVGDTAQKLFQRIDKTFQEVLQKLQHGLELNALAEHTRDTAQANELHALWRSGNHTEFFNRSKQMLGNLEVGGRLTEIEREMAVLRNRNYFPHMRFGQYAVYVRAKQDMTVKGRDYKGPRNGREGQVIYFETFENFHAREARLKELVKEFPPSVYDLGVGKVSDAEFAFLGMPPSLYEALGSRLNLNEQQRERLKELYFTRSPGRSFLKHLTKRKGVEGFSQDALRVYATYMMNAANHIARVEYHREMGSALTELRDAGQKMGDVAGFVRDYFGKHFDYIMNPADDWAALRGMGFLWYLGFNVKSALVNLTQVPMVAYPYLATHYGDRASVAALSKAYGTVVRLMRGQSVLDDAAQVDLNRALREGVIDQAQATELAAIAEAPVLQRLLPTNRGQKLVSELSYYGSFLFRHAETFNRRVTFLAARDLAIRKGLRGEDVFLAAKKAVQTAMFEYSKWNRPTMMRGKKSVFFLFWNYMQNMSYLAFGGEGRGTALRIWGLLLLTAGLQGLPFADDALDLADFGSTKAKELLGMKDPHTDLRLMLREIASQFVDNPDLVMHGLSRYYGLGPLHLLELIGVPVPGVDTSGSLSAGHVVPGVAELTGSTQDPDKAFGQAIIEGLGPVAGVGYNFWKMLTSRDPDTWKVWERAMPTSIKNASQAVRRWQRGEESFRGGGTVATFDPHNWQQRAEVIAGAFGFQSPRVSSRYEERSLQEELKRYWLSRRAMVLENYAYAVISKDQEALSDARKALQRFNGEVPAPQLKLSADSIANSLAQRLQRADLRTEALPPEDAFVPLYRRVTETFPRSEDASYSQPATPLQPPTQ